MRVTAWPSRLRAAARALSRMQLPQYIPPAPAARMLIFKAFALRLTILGIVGVRMILEHRSLSGTPDRRLRLAVGAVARPPPKLKRRRACVLPRGAPRSDRCPVIRQRLAQ